MNDRRTIGAALLPCLLLYAAALASAQGYSRTDDPALVLTGDPAYNVIDEAWLSAGLARPFLEGPQTVAVLWRAGYLAADSDPERGDTVLGTLADLFPEPRGSVDYAVRLALSGGWYQNPARKELLYPGGYTFLDSLLLTELLERDPLLDLRLFLRAGPLAVDVNPELKPSSNIYRTDSTTWTNITAITDTSRTDVNFPDRGIASVQTGAFQFRFGRDKLQLGPGRRSSLGVGYNLPWVDYGSAAADFGPVDVSWYVIRLNPVISTAEEAYLMAIRAGTEPQPDENAGYQLQGLERAKHLVASRYTVRPAGWLVLALTQYHLVGSRMLQLSDANPFILFHNLFQEGVYSVPATAEFSAVPVQGLEFYGQYMLYDATVADEVGSGTENAGASAWQLGLTALSTPWLDTGTDRLRLDLEFSKADPWIYGKYSSWRQFTSRYILVEPYAGRFWIDYPIGFHLGADAWETWLKLSYGNPARSELALEASYSVRGSVSLLGFGTATDYANKSDFVDAGWVLVRPGEAPMKTLKAELQYSFRPGSGLLAGRSGPFAELGATITVIEGYGFVPGDTRTWYDVAATLGWSF